MSRRARLGLIVAGTTLAVLVIGQLLFPGAHHPGAAMNEAVVAAAPTTAPAAPAEVSSESADAMAVVAGIPMGYRHDEAGARAAAATFAEAYGTLLALDEAGAVAAKRTMASSAAADALVAAMLDKLAPLRKVWAVGEITYRVAPLAVRVRMDGPDAASADVWYVGVIAGRGLATYEEWITQSYRLVWERDDWRIAAESDVPGPRPDPGRQSPATPAELESRLVGFEAMS